QQIQLIVPPGAFPDGTVVSVSPSVAVLPPPGSNQGSMSPIGSNTAFQLDAQGNQPASVVRIALSYDPNSLLPGLDPKTVQGAGWQPAAGKWTFQSPFFDQFDLWIVAEVQHFSLFSPFAVPAAQDLDNVSLFPVPWEPTSTTQLSNPPFLTVANAPPAARVR